MNDTAKKATIWVVLILVLMEKGGSDECRPRRYLSPRVLILVLMEKGGSDSRIPDSKGRDVLILVLMEKGGS